MQNKPYKILFFEDDLDTRQYVEKRLKNAGYHIKAIFPKTIDKGLAQAEAFRPNLLVVDIMLWDEERPDGIDLANEIQKKNTIPVIYLTAFDNPSLLDRAFRSNLAKYVVKETWDISERQMLIDIKQVLLPQAISIDVYERGIVGQKSKIKANDIEIIETDSKRRIVVKTKYLINGKAKFFAAYNTLYFMEKILPKNLFLRIHKSYIVNVTCVKVCKKTFLIVGETRRKLTIGRSRKKRVVTYMKRIGLVDD